MSEILFEVIIQKYYGGFFERFDRSTKSLLRKTLQTAKLTYEELQTVLYEAEQIISNRLITEQIISNRLITKYYYDNEESCLTPNHLFHGRTLKYSSNLLSDITPGELVTPKKPDNLLSHFWERWWKKYILN